MIDSFQTRGTLTVGGRTYAIARLKPLQAKFPAVAKLPWSHRILLENLLRTEDGIAVHKADIEALCNWDAKATPDKEIQFTPARTLLQDFTGVPCVVDLAAMRDAMKTRGGDPNKINPLSPVELVIDHSVQVDYFGTADAFAKNAEIEFERNGERYAFLRWGAMAFQDFKAVPPDTGIVHQVNLEFLARVTMDRKVDGVEWAYPDTVVGTDSHTTMINGLGVLGWGVGGIEAEAAMLGQPVSMLIPQVVGVRLMGKLKEGATATDLVLRVTEMLRKHGVVGKFVEFCGPGLSDLPLADRATIANMAPEYGATCGIFPVDKLTIEYLRLSGRSEERCALVEAYMKEQGLWHDASTPEPTYTDVLSLDLSTIEPALAGPKRPQDRVALSAVKSGFEASLESLRPKPAAGAPAPHPEPHATITVDGHETVLEHGSVVISAITSCTNTSNPSVLIAAGLVAKKAVEKGLQRAPHVKTSLAPGSKVVTEYLKKAGLTPHLDALGFQLVGYGCTTCIGNSGPLPKTVSTAIDESGIVAAAVLSGNRNFEGRVHAQVRANYLASPPLCVAYAIAGSVDKDITTEPLGVGSNGQPVYLKDIWPTTQEVADTMAKAIDRDMYARTYSDVYAGDERWQSLKVPQGATYTWDDKSTYVKHPPYFVDMPKEPKPVGDIVGARVLALFGDSITTDHISPAGNIKASSPAGKYLQSLGVKPEDFNSYGARRGNHEVMVRGTFANTRIKNLMLGGKEGGDTILMTTGETMSIYDAAMAYLKAGIPSIVLAGKEYGTGSSRDWAAKGPALQGVRCVIAESFERIHRSNLVGMGVLPLQFADGASASSLGLDGSEEISVKGIAQALSNFKPGLRIDVEAKKKDGSVKRFPTILRIDTANETQYYRHGGILQFVLRRLVAQG